MRQLLYIDLFCGAGGTSTGIAKARLHGEECARVIACVNHDPNAIASHSANHPGTLHFTEDIRTLDTTPLVQHTIREKQKTPGALVVLWASLECTNFSKAKGGQPRDADSRTLAEHLFRYIDTIQPDYIYIENVEEFMCWGDIDENGKPISKDKGRRYMQWVMNICKRHYTFAHAILNSADYGAYTSRSRFFGIFAKNNLPIVFPEKTYCKGGRKDMFGELKQWKSVRDVLDLQDEGASIFSRKKPLADRTLERIYAGLIKFVAGGKNAFIVKYNSMNQSGRYTPPSIDEPCPVVATQNRLGLAKVQFLSKQYGGEPAGKNISIDEPSGTITCIDHHAIATAKFLTTYYGGNKNAQSIEAPAPTLTTKDRIAVITTEKQPRQFLMNPQYKSAGGSIEKPCFTLIARMDKTPPHLISTEEGKAVIVIYKNDTPAMVKIKEFMALYGIADIKMRMLNVKELKRIMGFPENYTLIGTQTEQKKYIGNAVEVTMSKALCEALAERINEPIKKAI